MYGEYGDYSELDARLSYTEFAEPIFVPPPTTSNINEAVTEIIPTGGLTYTRSGGTVEIFPDNTGDATFGSVSQADALVAGSGLLGRSASEVRAAIETKKITTGTVSIDPGSIAATSTGTATATISGAAIGDVVSLGRPAGLSDDLIFSGCRITGANTLTVYLYNPTASPIDDGSLSWDYALIKA